MESNKTSRVTKRTQAYKNNYLNQNSNSSRTSLGRQRNLSSASRNNQKRSNDEVELRVSAPKRVKVEPKKVSPEELAEQKARHDQVLKREQKYKEDQKRRIEELMEQQKTREQKNKDIEKRQPRVEPQKEEPKVAKENKNLRDRDIAKLREELKSTHDEEQIPPIEEPKIDNVERLKKEKKLDEILTSNHSSRSKESLSLDDFVPKDVKKEVVKEPEVKKEVQYAAPKIDKNQMDYSLETKEDNKNSISKMEERDLLEKIGKINELELTNRINKLTKEVLNDIEEKASREIEEEKPTKSENKLLNTDVITLTKATKKALNDLEKNAKKEKKENKKAKKHPNKVKKNKQKETNSENEPKSKKKILPLLFVLVISIGIFIYSSINIVKWQKDNIDTKDITEDINEIVEPEEVPDSENVEIIEPQIEVPKSNPYWDYIKVPLINVNFSELKSKNSETVGWIQVMGTNINYPFVQTKNNSYYLSHSFDKSTNQAGWVFMDYRNNVKDFDRNNIIYAHGRLDTTMFGSLKNILSSGWLKNKDNYVIRLSTEYENTLWQVFSVYRIKTTNDYIQVDFDSDEEFSNFAKMLTNRSAHNFNTTVSATDKILTLSTCYNQTDKVVLHAKLIKVESRS